MENYRYNSSGTIDCDIEHNTLGVIPTTLTKKESVELECKKVEIAPYLEPVKTVDDIRQERDLLLIANVDIYNPIRWSELSTEQKNAVKSYRQALLDITKQDPASVIWPTLTI